MTTNPFHGEQNKTAWDTLILGPYIFPGLASVTVDHTFNYDVIKPRGNQLAHVRPMGTEPRRVSVSLLIMDADEYLELTKNIMPHLAIKGNSKEIKPFTISHPQCELFGIKEVVIETISPGIPSSSDGWVIEFGFIEWVNNPRKMRSSKDPAKPTFDPNNPEHRRVFNDKAASMGVNSFVASMMARSL